MKKTDIKKLTDEQLVEKVTDGDQELYEFVVDRYQAKLLRYVMSILSGNQSAAQDVSQEVFIKAFINLRKFNTKKKFSSWIYRIAHNEAINHINKHKKELVQDDDSWIDALPDYRDSNDEIMEKSFKKKTVKKVLATLDIKYREPLVLHVFEGYSYSEISTMLRIPSPTVGTRINRAKDKLKRELQSELEG